MKENSKTTLSGVGRHERNRHVFINQNTNVMKEREIIKDFVKAVKAENGEMTDEICIRAYFQNIPFYRYLYLRVDYKGDVVGMWTRNDKMSTIKSASVSEVINAIWDFHECEYKEVETVDPGWFFE